MIITGKYPQLRLRRSRKYDWSRRLIEENNLTSNDFILPIFLIDGKNKKQPIKSMPDVFRYSLDKMNFIIDKAIKNKLPMVALFPHTERKKKDSIGTEALNEDNLVCKAIQEIKSSVIDLSIEAASKILEKNLDSKENRKLVDQTLDSIGQA